MDGNEEGGQAAFETPEVVQNRRNRSTEQVKQLVDFEILLSQKCNEIISKITQIPKFIIQNDRFRALANGRRCTAEGKRQKTVGTSDSSTKTSFCQPRQCLWHRLSGKIVEGDHLI